MKIRIVLDVGEKVTLEGPQVLESSDIPAVIAFLLKHFREEK